MTIRNEALLIISGYSERRAITAYKALAPEASKATKGASVTISISDGGLVLHFHAHTVPALRALMNSYLRWLLMLEEVLDIIERNIRKNIKVESSNLNA